MALLKPRFWPAMDGSEWYVIAQGFKGQAPGA